MTNKRMDALIAGALFDFAGHLTTMDEVYEIGAARDSTRMVAELQAWASKRGLDLSDADVMNWQDKQEIETTGGVNDAL